MAARKGVKSKTGPEKSRKTVKGSSARKSSRQKKVMFLVIDGLADRMKGGKTPLKTARTPNLDWMSRNGVCGRMSLITKPMWKSIDTLGVSQYANVSLLGYNPANYELDRGPLEAVGLGIPYNDGHLALRCNFATVDGDMRMVDRRAGRSSFGLDDIARHVNHAVKIGEEYVFMRTYGHRAVLVIKRHLPKNVRGNDTAEGEIVPRIEGLDDDSAEAARIVQSFVDNARNQIRFYPKNSERIDKGLPSANYIIVRQPGNHVSALPSFAKKWKLKNAVCIAENGVMKATCMLAGFSSIGVPEFSSHEDWIDHVFDNIDSSLAEYDFVYAHIKSADEAAHDKDPEKKETIIEYIDSRLEDYKNFNGIIVVTCDHITSSDTGQHEYGEVPVLVYGKGKDTVDRFDESSVKKGSLGKMGGKDLLKFIFGK